MKLSLLIIFLLLIISDRIYSQPIREYVLQNKQRITSINPADTNYTDLEVIGSAIGNSGIVMLGEQDHGDAPTFLAKTRLIKYLREKKGFDVILFESDWYSLTASWEAYKQKEIAIENVYQNIFGIWTGCDACTDLFQYIKATQNSTQAIAIGGFDNQLHGDYRKGIYKKDVLRALSSLPGANVYRDRLSPFLDIVENKYPLSTANPDTATLTGYGKMLDNLQLLFQSLPDTSYDRILIENLRSYAYKQIHFNAKSNETMTVRDRQMATNFKWLLATKYAGRKVIVWAANYHIAKNISDIYFPDFTGKFVTMGTFIAEEFAKEMYVLGFDSYQGKAGRIYVKPFKVARPEKDAIESWFNTNNDPYAFIDFKPYRAVRTVEYEYFKMKGKSHYTNTADWTKIFDGVFYIRDMYPCRRIDK